MLPGRVPYSTDQPGIFNFKLNTLNRTSLPVESMSAVVVTTGDTTTLVRGQTYTVTINHTRDAITFPTVRNNIRVWIDYDHNYSFAGTGETVISSDLQTFGVYTNTFTVPSTAPLGYTRLRATAKMSSEGGHSFPTACDSPADPLGYHGEMEDYTVKIITGLGVAEQEPGKRFTVYPNPAIGDITVAFETIENSQVAIDLYDVTGRLAGRLFSGVQSAQEYHFNLNDFISSSGIWFIRISAPGSSSYQKVIVSK